MGELLNERQEGLEEFGGHSSAVSSYGTPGARKSASGNYPPSNSMDDALR